MKLPIPDDWNGEDWFCTEVRWPDSPQFVGLLVGFLSAMTRGRYWDETTGSIKDIQAIALDVFDANFPFVPCCDDETTGASEPETNESAESALIGAICMECSIPYGTLRWNDGVLEYRYCGEWYAVGGESGDPDWGDPGDPDVGDPPAAWVDATACSKATVWCDVVNSIVETLLEQALDDVNPFDGLRTVKALYPDVVFGDLQLFSAYMSAAKIAVAFLTDDTTAPDVKQRILCQVSAVMSDGNQGMTSDEYEAARAAIWGVVQSEFSWTDYAILDVEMRNIWTKAAWSIGPNDSMKLTTMAQPTGLEDCTCPPEAGGYDADIVFTGAYSNGAGTGVVEDVTVVEDGKAAVITLAASNGDWRDLADIKLTLANAEGVENLVIRMSPESGLECPTEEWQTFAPVTNPTQWMIPIMLDTTDTQHGTHSYAQGAGYLEVRSIRTPESNLFAKVEFDARWAPQTGGFGGTKRYYVRFEIVEVNLTDYR